MSVLVPNVTVDDIIIFVGESSYAKKDSTLLSHISCIHNMIDEVYEVIGVFEAQSLHQDERSYNVKVLLSSNDGTIITTSCSCPLVSMTCKHVAKLLHKATQSSKTLENKSKDFLLDQGGVQKE